MLIDALDLDPISRLKKDLIDAAKLMSSREARYMVDNYYQIQEYRKAAHNQNDAALNVLEPHRVINWYGEQMEALENQIKRSLDAWSNAQTLGRWARSITGVGPVIAAGLLAHIDVTKPSVGHIWSFAGLIHPDQQVWEKGKKRPWNADLKTLTAFKLGECFVKVCNNEKDFYGHHYVTRKALEWENNLSGALEDQAVRATTKRKFDPKTEAIKWYSGVFDPEDVKKSQAEGKSLLDLPKAREGRGVKMLPPAHIHARARRWTVKFFLSHYHYVGYSLAMGTPPPKPWVIEHGGHIHFVPPPNWPMVAETPKVRKTKTPIEVTE